MIDWTLGITGSRPALRKGIGEVLAENDANYSDSHEVKDTETTWLKRTWRSNVDCI